MSHLSCLTDEQLCIFFIQASHEVYKVRQFIVSPLVHVKIESVDEIQIEMAKRSEQYWSELISKTVEKLKNR
jgi:hypothetical protein